MRTSSETSQFKTAVFVCISHVLFSSCRKFTLSKFFGKFSLSDGPKINTELYGICSVFPLVIAMSESLEVCQFSSTEAISTHCYNVSASN